MEVLKDTEWPGAAISKCHHAGFILASKLVSLFFSEENQGNKIKFEGSMKA